MSDEITLLEKQVIEFLERQGKATVVDLVDKFGVSALTSLNAKGRLIFEKPGRGDPDWSTVRLARRENVHEVNDA